MFEVRCLKNETYGAAMEDILNRRVVIHMRPWASAAAEARRNKRQG